MTENVKGFPRPVGNLNGQNTPMPWVGGIAVEDGRWAEVQGSRAIQSEKEELCLVCGLPLTSDFIYMLAFGRKSDHAPDLFGLLLNTDLPSPTWAHPKCGRIASLYCPHLKKAEYPAMTQNGEKLTHDQLAELAKHAKAPK